MWWALFFMDPFVNDSNPENERIGSFTVEDRIDRLESQVWELRALLHASGQGTPPPNDLQPASNRLSNLTRNPGGKPSSSLEKVLFPINRFMRNWVLAPLGFVQSISWLRRTFLLLVGGAILLSNWWLPFSGVWVVGGIFERVVILVLAGIWWYMVLGARSHFPREKKRYFAKPSPTGWFGSRAS